MILLMSGRLWCASCRAYTGVIPPNTDPPNPEPGCHDTIVRIAICLRCDAVLTQTVFRCALKRPWKRLRLR